MTLRPVLVLLLLMPAMPASAEEKPHGRLFVETGVEVGHAFGVEGPTHSRVRGVTEIGYLFDLWPGEKPATWAFGATVYGALGGEDFRFGIKPRVRYRFRDDWSADVSAGYIFATLENDPYVSDTGFVAGVNINHGRWVSFRADVNVKSVQDRTRPRQLEWVLVEGGHEVAVYGGISLRQKAGWWATAVGTAAILGLMLFILASGGAS